MSRTNARRLNRALLSLVIAAGALALRVPVADAGVTYQPPIDLKQFGFAEVNDISSDWVVGHDVVNGAPRPRVMRMGQLPKKLDMQGTVMTVNETGQAIVVNDATDQVWKLELSTMKLSSISVPAAAKGRPISAWALVETDAFLLSAQGVYENGTLKAGIGWQVRPTQFGWTFTTLPVHFEAHNMNASGTVVGTYHVTFGEPRKAALWQPHTGLAFIGDGVARGINDHGHVVGFSDFGSPESGGWVWFPKSNTRLDLEELAGADEDNGFIAEDITNGGLIAGDSAAVWPGDPGIGTAVYELSTGTTTKLPNDPGIIEAMSENGNLLFFDDRLFRRVNG
jgi:hypothetical protein